MSDKTLDLVEEDKNQREGYEQVKAKFLELVRDVEIGNDFLGDIKTRRRTREELGEAMIYLNQSGYAEEVLEDERVMVYYNLAYIEVFGWYIYQGQIMKSDSFEMYVFDSIPGFYKKKRKEWGQLPKIADNNI